MVAAQKRPTAAVTIQRRLVAAGVLIFDQAIR